MVGLTLQVLMTVLSIYFYQITEVKESLFSVRGRSNATLCSASVGTTSTHIFSVWWI